jgi:AcrR family transcriptional regulator
VYTSVPLSAPPQTDILAVLPRGRHAAPRAVVRSTQRARMLEAMVVAVADKGFARVAVADVVERAGVSRKTFYEQFANKEECFLAAYDAGVDGLMGAIDEALAQAVGDRAAAPAAGSRAAPRGARVRAAEQAAGTPAAERGAGVRDAARAAGTRAAEPAAGPPGRLAPDWLAAARRAVEVYLERMAAGPAFARAFLIEVLGAGPDALARRDVVQKRFAAQLAAIHRRARADIPGIPAVGPHVFRAAVGAVSELVTAHVLEHGAETLPELADAILEVHLALLVGRELAARISAPPA